MNSRTKYIIAGVSVVLAFAGGRFLAPEKVKIETKIVEVEKKTKVKDKKKDTTIVEITRPDGTKEKKTVITEDTKTKTDQETKTDTSKSVERIGQSGKTHISLLAGGTFSSGLTAPVVFGGHITHSVFGPITIGVFGLSNGTFGGSAGVQF
jgi:hypothetical protein